MPMRYAHQPDVLAQLKLEETDTAEIERLVRLENGLAAAFNQKIGRSFGTAAVAETREVAVPDTSSRLVTSVGMRVVTSIETGGTWDGTAWLDGDTVPAADYRLTLLDHDGLYWGIDHLAGGWAGPVRITATWGDQPEALVPDDVREALTFITVDEYRARNASPAGEIGPDGLVVRARNPWGFTLVRQAIERHRLVRLVV